MSEQITQDEGLEVKPTLKKRGRKPKDPEANAQQTQRVRNQILLTFRNSGEDLELYNWLINKYNTTYYIKDQLLNLMKYGTVRLDVLVDKNFDITHANKTATKNDAPPNHTAIPPNDVAPSPKTPEEDASIQQAMKECVETFEQFCTEKTDEPMPEGERVFKKPKRKVGGFS